MQAYTNTSLNRPRKITKPRANLRSHDKRQRQQVPKTILLRGGGGPIQIRRPKPLFFPGKGSRHSPCPVSGPGH